MCYILCMCVCVGASDTTTTSDDPCASGAFLGGSQGGGRYAPPWLHAVFGATPRNFFFGRFLLFLADL
jgi:hypothetical protein